MPVLLSMLDKDFVVGSLLQQLSRSCVDVAVENMYGIHGMYTNCGGIFSRCISALVC